MRGWPRIIAPCRSALRRHLGNSFLLQDGIKIWLQDPQNKRYSATATFTKLTRINILPSFLEKLHHVVFPHLMHWFKNIKSVMQNNLDNRVLQVKTKEDSYKELSYKNHLSEAYFFKESINYDMYQLQGWLKIPLWLGNANAMHPGRSKWSLKIWSSKQHMQNWIDYYQT